MKKQIRNNLIILLLAILVGSCVGEVDKSKAEKTEFYNPTPDKFVYPGIIDTRAIAHDKIEIDFYPAGDQTVFTHYLQINGTNKPIELKLDTIPRLEGGLLRYALSGLQINSYYTLKISAVNNFTGAVSYKEKVVEDARTFDNKVADFKGISKVSAVPGAASSSVLVQWNPATFEGIISASTYDPVYYEITYLPASAGYQNLNNPAYNGGDRVVLQVKNSTGGDISYSDHPTFKEIGGLTPNTTYYFQVRAVHQEWRKQFNQDPNNITIDRELNSVFLKHTTAPATNFFDWDGDTVVVKNAPSINALTRFRVNWEVGEGNYTHYRLFVTQYGGPVNEDFWQDDELNKDNDLHPDQNKLDAGGCVQVPQQLGLVEASLSVNARDNHEVIGCFDVPTTVYNLEIKNLKAYTGYHVKVAICREADCTLDIADANVGKLSPIRYAYTEPSLAGFDGINFIVQPQDPTKLKEITLTFNAPNTAAGYADTLEVYCVDPTDYQNMDQLNADRTALGGAATISRCADLIVTTKDDDGLVDINNFGDIPGVNSLRITNVKNQPDPDATYCFAMSPAITQNLPAGVSEKKIAIENRVVRCISPEVKVPTSDEFPGVNGLCQVNKNKATVSWSAPTGGIYTGYRVFLKLSNSESFNFGNAIAGAAGYTERLSTALSEQFTGLEPGNNYEIGVLTYVDDEDGVRYHSEANLNVVECRIPLPVPSFSEWTRIFAIGPKINGRFPTIQDTDDNNPWPTFRTEENSGPQFESRIYEAISTEGIPYEVDPADNVTFYSAPPGEGTNFNPLLVNTFDGEQNSEGLAASKTGIISIAWKEVELDYLGPEFAAAQAADDLDRSQREYGYRVYRSSDYGLSYQLISGNRLIRSIPYSYRPRSNADPITVRMAFFTDYSVRYAEDLKDISRARVYSYKVVPVYKGKELKYNDPSGAPKHMIRVTLPPPNMALMHRMMANRSACMELNRDIEITNNYACEYNGLGARPRSIPWQAGQALYDIGGDLLVDRYELGCNFTRGYLPTDVSEGAHTGQPSYFMKEDDDNIDWNQYALVGGSNGYKARNDFSIFEGFSNSGTVFRGCGQKAHIGDPGGLDAHDNPNYEYGLRSETTSAPYFWFNLNSAQPTYNNVLFGDCYGASRVTLPTVRTPPGTMQANASTINSPGVRWTVNFNEGENYDWTKDDPINPHNYRDLFSRDLERSNLAIGEYAAVYYNSNSFQGSAHPAIGPGNTQSEEGVKLFTTNTERHSTGPNCFVNLASIGANLPENQAEMGSGEYWRSRWFPMGNVDEVQTNAAGEGLPLTESLYKLTLDQIITKKGLYDDNKSSGTKYFKAPAKTFWDSNRIVGDMPLARVVATNNAKMPGMYGVSPQEFNKICSTFRIQVGVQSDSGHGEYQPLSAPMSKRIMRRNELVMASAFPDIYYEDNPDVFSDDFISDIERGASSAFNPNTVHGLTRSPASCHSPNKSQDDGYYKSGGKYGTRATDQYQSSSPHAFRRIMSGSGALDNSDFQTENCTSRYGIHDLIGNGVELSSEQLFCDYSQEGMAIYYGFGTGHFTGYTEWSVIYPYHNDYGLGRAGVKLDAPIKYPMNGLTGDITQDIKNLVALRGASFDPTSTAGEVGNWRYYPDGCDVGDDCEGIERFQNNSMWRYIDPEAGYCSLVDSNKSRVDNPNNFVDAQSQLISVFNIDGSVNTDMIKRLNNVDQESVDWLRNGDGYFLNFGDSNLSVGMKNTGTMSLVPLTVDGIQRMEGLYFSPVTGIPVKCDTYSGSAQSCDPTTSIDNKKYTIKNFWVNIPGTDPDNDPDTDPIEPLGLEVTDFPVGNSVISNIGISEIDETSSPGIQQITLDTTSQGGIEYGRLALSFTWQGDSNYSTEQKEFFDIAQEEGPVVTINYFHQRWAIPRNHLLIFANGGTGRYGLNLVHTSSGEVYGHDKSARCAIKINEDM